MDVTNVSATYAGVNIAGPGSRAVLRGLCPDVDLSAAGFPYMGVRMGVVAGIEARLLRAGFVGELGYEIHVPASQGEALWDALMEAGCPRRHPALRCRGPAPPAPREGPHHHRPGYGRRDHAARGRHGLGDLAQRSPSSWASAPCAPRTPGHPRASWWASSSPTRATRCPRNATWVIRGSEITGRVTSASYSPTLGRVVGLAYVAPDQAAPGTRFDIRVHGGRMVVGEVAPLPHYDPENKRQEM